MRHACFLQLGGSGKGTEWLSEFESEGEGNGAGVGAYWRLGAYLAINEWGWVGYEELSRSRMVLSTEAEGRGW